MYIKVKVTPNARHDSVTKLATGHYEVSVKAPPKGGLANAAVHRLLSEHLQMAPHQVRLVSGHRSPSKTFSLH